MAIILKKDNMYRNDFVSAAKRLGGFRKERIYNATQKMAAVHGSDDVSIVRVRP